MEAELRRVLEAAFPDGEARYFLPMPIGSTSETADEGAVLILNGTKTLTSSELWDYPDGKIPFFVGALGVLLDGSKKRRRGIVETTQVFGAITEEMACAYGEGERMVEWWRRVTGAFYRGSAARYDATLTDETPHIRDSRWSTASDAESVV
jgi:uncharacterized protein YhfF